MKEPKVKTCPKCGVTFECTTNGGNCWCNQYTISPENLKFLNENFSNCLCESCLKDYATTEETKVNF